MIERTIIVLGLSLILLMPLVGLGNTSAQNNTNGTLTGKNMTNSTGSNIISTNLTSSNPSNMSQGQSGPNPTGSNIPCVAGNPCM